MKTAYKTSAATLSVLVLTLLFASNSSAQCGGLRQPMKPLSGHYQLGQALLLRTGAAPAGIVGFWHVKFVSEGSTGIPDGTEVDAGYSQWHSDGTEIMNSGGRSPITGNFCLGVWKQVGEGKYLLNHFAISWNSAGADLVGPGNIREAVTLDKDGDKFAGTFTIDQYDESGNKLAHVQGVITGTRITVNTQTQSIF
jgi:hypothetical protein